MTSTTHPCLRAVRRSWPRLRVPHISGSWTRATRQRRRARSYHLTMCSECCICAQGLPCRGTTRMSRSTNRTFGCTAVNGSIASFGVVDITDRLHQGRRIGSHWRAGPVDVENGLALLCMAILGQCNRRQTARQSSHHGRCTVPANFATFRLRATCVRGSRFRRTGDPEDWNRSGSLWQARHETRWFGLSG